MVTRVHNMPKIAEKISVHLPKGGAIAPYPPTSDTPSGDDWGLEPYIFTKPPSELKFLKISMQCYHFHILIFHVKNQSKKCCPLKFSRFSQYRHLCNIGPPVFIPWCHLLFNAFKFTNHLFFSPLSVWFRLHIAAYIYNVRGLNRWRLS